MPGRPTARPHRSQGSWIPRLTGIGVVGVLAIGGLVAYLASAHHVAPHRHHHHHRRAVLSSKVIKKETVGIIDFGPDNDHDVFRGDKDDHPLMLQPGKGGLEFVKIPVAELTAGMPVWTADHMSDGSDIFIYTATGQCLSASAHNATIVLAHCDLGLSQRWRPVDVAAALGQAYAKYASALNGLCLTAPDARPGPAALRTCGSAKRKAQQIAFWWNA
jgi:hypothetical protein